MWSAIHSLAPTQWYWLVIRLVVSSRPRCPPVGELCHVWRISRLRGSSGGTVSRSFFMSLHHSPVGLVTRYRIPCDSSCCRCGRYLCCVLIMVFSRELGESSSRTRMKVVSGIIVTSWLSSLPSSDPKGRDKASAAV